MTIHHNFNTMDANSILNAFSSHNRSGIAGLIFDILVLEGRLSDHKRQSEYFQMGIRNHIENLTKLHRRYTDMRKEFNSMTTDMCIAEIHAQQALLVWRANMRPFINRAFGMAGCHGIIHRMNDFIGIKRIVQQLPDVESLKSTQDLLSEIFEAHR